MRNILILSLFAVALSVVGLNPSSVDAANNIQQKSDGTTVWTTSRRGASDQEVPVGPGMVTMLVSSISAEITGYTVMPFAGIIKKVYTVVAGTAQTGAAAVARVYVGPQNSNGRFAEVTDGSGASDLTIAQNASRGVVDSWSPNGNASALFDAGDVVAITFDGGGTSTNTGAWVSIVIAPR